MTDAALEKIVINGVEYDPTDAQTLIEAGTKARDFEKQWNTKLDNVYPDYTRATQEAARAKELQIERDALKVKAEEYDRVRNHVTGDDNSRKALEAARSLGLADQEYLRKEGYLTETQLTKILDERQNQQSLVQNVLNQADKLEKDIDGLDGRVPFNKKAVLAYASAYNISDLNKAYDEMNEGANKSWKEQQLSGAKRPGLTTLKSGGLKAQPAEKELTKDNFADALKETLWGTE